MCGQEAAGHQEQQSIEYLFFKLLNLVIPDAAGTGKSQVESTCEDWEKDKYKEEKKWKKTGCKVHLS